MPSALFLLASKNTHTQSYDYFMENYSNTLWVSLYLHCNSIIYWHFFFDLHCTATFVHCLKITENISFNIASEASYVYDKSSLKMPKMVDFVEFLKTWSLRSNSVTRQVTFNRTKIGGKSQNWKIKMGHFWWFSNTVYLLRKAYLDRKDKVKS